MKLKPHDVAEKGRIIVGPYASPFGERYGAFVLTSPFDRKPMKVIASDGDDQIRWEHVSISREDRCPMWEEMCYVKGLFWSDEESVVQFHPPKSQYVNNHNYCLHLWRPVVTEIELPPSIAVGLKSIGLLSEVA